MIEKSRQASKRAAEDSPFLFGSVEYVPCSEYTWFITGHDDAGMYLFITVY